MALSIHRFNVRLNPDYKKVIPRFFNTGDQRSQSLINKILSMPDEEANAILKNVLEEFSPQYKKIANVFLKHFEVIKRLLTEKDLENLSDEKRLLIGSYFTMEYSIESAALFNPSIVEDPDQSGVEDGEKRVIISFRATGENHISSIIFKRATLDANAMIHFEPSGTFLSEGVITQQKKDNKLEFEVLLSQMGLPKGLLADLLSQLKDPFSYKEIVLVLKNALQRIESPTEKVAS